MASSTPRAVLVTRETDYEHLLARHATRDQAGFFLRTRGQDIAQVQARHERFRAVLHQVRGAIPVDWRVTHVQRPQLDRFLFAPEDVVIVVGQDGLVANVAKYLNGQPVLGVNSDPELYDGVLVPLSAALAGKLLLPVAQAQVRLEQRTMARAMLDDGQTLLALNEVFIGHRTHQSARYLIRDGGASERQSSSGIIVSTGTGATGWAKSIMQACGKPIPLAPTEPALAYFVREPFGSVATGTSLTAGKLQGSGQFAVTSNINEGGCIFADGIEADRLAFDWGRTVEVTVADRTLNLVRG